MIEFRKAILDDALTIVSTRQKVWDATYRGIYPDAVIDDFDYDWHLKMERTRLENENFHCFMVLDKEACVGYFSFGKVKPGAWNDFSFRLHSLYLLPKYQGLGLGRIIFQQVRENCKSLGYTKMYLDCHPENNNALAFYKHMGGVVTHVDGGHDNKQEDCCTIEFDFTEGE